MESTYSDRFFWFNDGGRFDPLANAWWELSTNSAPTAREGPTAVWTGSQMIVWGGYNGSLSPFYPDTGGRYDPLANTWVALPTIGAPGGRVAHTAVWTGSEMVLWGGYNGPDGSYGLNTGGRYNLVANSWTALPATGEPPARYWHTAVWTGSQMIVWGGYNSSVTFYDTWSYYPYAPAVRISRLSHAGALVAWPVWCPSLCQTTNLAGGPWTTVTNAVTQVGAENHVTLSPLSGGQFFRAEYP